MNKSIKKRNWALVVYPESAPPSWQEILQQKGVQCAISPLHDKDLNADGEQKKAHWHVILCFTGPTTYNSVKAICDELCCPAPQPLESVRGYYRYLTHKDNPEKAQYSDLDIITLNGFDILDYVEMSKTEVIKAKAQIIDLIEDNDITEYMQIVLLCKSLDNSLFDVVSSHTIFFGKFIDSRRNSRSTSNIVDDISEGDDVNDD